ncbi:MAG: arsenic resistance protein [Tepidimonas sp.]|uniref:arsenic resistance protein n=1 Tax=Tepidimonas sp. TaxID=2002775 RepID=UPI00259E0F11|nr:arsenic resistance protein [Tepidimonas sp.]MDM7456289.1 arsenic resistance protein [Tepidimonas sp.]
MNRLVLERYQVGIYAVAIAAGLLVGGAWPHIAPVLEACLWPTLALLLYATFVQVPLWHVRDAFRDHRFITAMLMGNFVVVPAVVAALLAWLPPDPGLRLGVAMVLLVPCTDWFITFSQLGGANVARAIATTPINLLLQLALLPVYLWLLLDVQPLVGWGLADFAPALGVVATPLLLAAISECWIEARPARHIWRERLAWWPVPLLAVVVFLIAGAQAHAAWDALGYLTGMVPVFVAFLLLGGAIAKALARLMRLPRDQGRTLAFSLGTRNSFVVLPFALTLPAGWELVALTIVLQSLVELVGMVFYLWWIPRHLFR